MRWFGNKNREGHIEESPGVKPKNQILRTSLDKERPTKSWELPPEKKKEINESLSEIGKKYSNSDKEKLKRPQKLDNPNASSDEGNPAKGQRLLERGHVTERE